MRIGTEQIENEIRDNFGRTYKAFGSFVDSGFLWDECIGYVRDTVMLSHIIFCNDIHQIPPVHTFLRANKNIRTDLSEIEKRSIGAFWGFVFKYVFGYRNQKSATAKVNTVKTSTYFFDAPEEVTIIDDSKRCASFREPCKIYDIMVKGYQTAVRIADHIVPVNEYGSFCAIDGMLLEDNGQNGGENTAVFEQGGKYGAFRVTTGEMLVPPIYEMIEHFYLKNCKDGGKILIAMAKSDGKYGVISSYNEVREPFIWDKNTLYDLLEEENREW